MTIYRGNECDEDEVHNKRNVLNNRRGKKKKERIQKIIQKKIKKNGGKKKKLVKVYKKIKKGRQERRKPKKQNINKFDNDKKYVDMNYENMKRGNKRYSSMYEKRRVHNTNEYGENEKNEYMIRELSA
ncbi:hypothetical protein PFDG_04472 [Plasmodium falciparum Dd2]|uniref:Uncharacterized protein n=1 Tax=Plasmodium falciparum (isolate Dd2) TaxID=57267 RepID=A0A0L7M8G6_PLAF4|nr:hypothetical protein PFDG_04472 [Plasmodium falciparum Dd2]